MIVAVLVVSVKRGLIASGSKTGFSAFAVAVILTIYVTAEVTGLTNDPGNNALK